MDQGQYRESVQTTEAMGYRDYSSARDVVALLV